MKAWEPATWYFIRSTNAHVARLCGRLQGVLRQRLWGTMMLELSSPGPCHWTLQLAPSRGTMCMSVVPVRLWRNQGNPHCREQRIEQGSPIPCQTPCMPSLTQEGFLTRAATCCWSIDTIMAVTIPMRFLTACVNNSVSPVVIPPCTYVGRRHELYEGLSWWDLHTGYRAQVIFS